MKKYYKHNFKVIKEWKVKIMKYNDFEYKKNNNEIMLMRYTGKDVKMKIPSFIEGCPVTSVSPKCFIQYDELGLVSKYSIEEFIVDDDHPSFSCYNGALYSKDMTTLYRYPHIKQLTAHLPDTLKIIQTYAFAYCSHIIEICIPQSVQQIQKLAFYKAMQLGHMVVDSKNPYFASMNGILYDKGIKTLIVCPPGYWNVHLIIPKSVYTMENYAFHHCCLIRHIELPNHIQCISDYCFYGCDKLQYINIPVNLKVIGKRAFSSCAIEKLDLPDSIAFIDDYAFEKCYYIQNMTIPQNVRFIGEKIFNCHHRLLIINVHENSRALKYVIENKYSYQIIEKIEKIDFLFEIENKGITLMKYLGHSDTIHIPAILQGFPVIRIHHNCFDKNDVLSFVVDQNNTYLTSVDGVIFSKDMKRLIAYPNAKEDTIYSIPEGVTTIDMYAFNENRHLESIIFPGSLTTIHTLAFHYCYALTHINIAKNIQNIERGAFANCQQLKAYHVDQDNPYYAIKDGVIYTKNLDTLIFYPNAKESYYFKIPDGVTCIKKNAFSYCFKTHRVFIPSSVKTIEDDAFALCYHLWGIDVDINSEYFKSDNGFLYDKYDHLIVKPCCEEYASVHM